MTEEDEKFRAAMHMVLSTARLHRAVFDRVVSEDIGLHQAQHHLLMTLTASEHPPSQKELADRFEVSPAAITGMMKKLEADGYITRRPSPNDCRVNEITVTKEGTDIVDTTLRRFSDADRRCFVGIGEEEMETLVKTLGIIQENLRQMGVGNSDRPPMRAPGRKERKQ